MTASTRPVGRTQTMAERDKRRRAQRLPTDGLWKGAAVIPALSAGALMTVMIWPALPGPLQVGASCSMAIVSALLLVGSGESVAARLLFGARRMSQTEDAHLRSVMSDLEQLGLNLPMTQVYVARRPGSPICAAVGRRSMILSCEVLAAITARQLPRREAMAFIAHAIESVRSGMSRQDALIRLWSLPWLLLSTLGRPFGRLLNPAWKLRGLLVAVAVWRSLVGDTPTSGSTNGAAIGCALATLLALTYAAPHASKSWRDHVIARADDVIVSTGLGPDLVRLLRRLPRTRTTDMRLRRLAPGPIRSSPLPRRPCD
jgi:hypothetical protein